MPTNKPEVVLPELPAITRYRVDGDIAYPVSEDPDGSMVDYDDHVAAIRAYGQACIDTLTRPAAGEFVMVRKEAIDWLNGEGPFECPPDRYFRGEPPRHWWRSVFREKAGLSASPQQHGQEVVGTPYRCDYCGADYGARACCDMRYEYLRKFGENILPPLSAQKPAEAAALPPIVREVLEWYASDPSIWVGWTQDDFAEEEAAKKSGHYRYIGEDKSGHNEYVPNHVRAEEALIELDQWLESTAQRTPPPAIDIGKLRDQMHALALQADGGFNVGGERHMRNTLESVAQGLTDCLALIGGGGEKANG